MDNKLLPARRSLRERLNQALPTHAEYNEFCLDFFPKVFHDTPPSSSHKEKITKLLAEADLADIQSALDRYLAETSAPEHSAPQGLDAVDSAPPAQSGAHVRSQAARSPAKADGASQIIGHRAMLDAIAARLPGHRCVIVCGDPGVGKTHLVREYAQEHQHEYPGGIFFVCFTQLGAPLNLMLQEDGLSDEPSLAARQALGRIATQGRALLIYEGIRDESVLAEWLPRPELDWHLLVTSNCCKWPSQREALHVQPPVPSAPLALVRQLLIDEYLRAEQPASLPEGTRRSMHRAWGLTEVAARIHESRPHPAERAAVSNSGPSRFAEVYAQLSVEGRRLLGLVFMLVSTRIPESLRRTVMESIGWSRNKVDEIAQGLGSSDLGTAQDVRREVHQLLDRLVRDRRRPLPGGNRSAAFFDLTKLASEFVQSPGDRTRKVRLQMFDLRCAAWADVAASQGQLHAMGDALMRLGACQQALPWFLRAVEQIQSESGHGYRDRAALGHSLHAVGFCHIRLGQFVEALLYLCQAIEEKEAGDLCGRTDQASVGSSLHLVGFSLSSQRQFQEAQGWFERAVVAKRQGNIAGRVDAASVGSSLHQVGFCLMEQGRIDEALPWFRQAVDDKEKGDLNGRVDAASLGSSLHQVGTCLKWAERFSEALPWYQRAVESKQKTDTQRPFDFACLGRSLHDIGECLLGMGDPASAQAYFQRAVEEKQKGDLQHRVDSASLGLSQHMVGTSVLQQGQLLEAQEWFVRAVCEKQKGDLHGRIDQASIGRSQHEIGYCLWRQDRIVEAAPWFESAVVAGEAGDVHQRVNAASVGVSLHWWSSCLFRQGRYSEALQCSTRSVEVLATADIKVPILRNSLCRSMQQLACCMRALGKFAEAEAWSARAADLNLNGQ